LRVDRRVNQWLIGSTCFRFHGKCVLANRDASLMS
jgi:hypothetical protein